MENSLNHTDNFLKELTGKYIISSTFGMLALFAGALIDTVVVGLFLKENGLSAMSLVSPVYLIYYTIGAVVGIGGSITAGICIGKGDYEKYRRIFTLSFTILSVLAVLSTIAGLVFLDFFTNILSGGNNTEFVHDYLKYYFAGGGFTLISYIPLFFLKVDGRPRHSSMLYTGYAVLNTALTFLFMSPICDMGIKGASLATSISMATASITGIFILLHGGETKFVRNFFSLDGLRKIVIDGIPGGFSNLLESLRIIIINSLLLSINVSLLPAFTVVRNITNLLSAFTIGTASALLPINSVFFAEHNFVNVRLTFKYIMKIGIVVSLIASSLVMIFPGEVTTFFGITDMKIIADTRTALPLACAGIVISYVNIHFTNYFNAINHTALSNVILFLRMVLWLVLTALPLSYIMGGKGIWLSFTASEAFTLASCLIIITIIRKRKGLDRYFLNEENENPEITFSVKNNIDAIIEASVKITNFCESNNLDANKTMWVSLAIEEILQVIILKCIPADKESFIDIRIVKLDDKVLMRIRNSGMIFNPVLYYEENKLNAEMTEELLGLTMIIKSAENVDFRKTFGANNLTITF